MIIAAPIVMMFVLHAPGGVDVTIASGQITFLRDPPKERSTYFPAEANCLVGLTDGKAVPVIETCAFICGLIEENKKGSQ